MIQAFITIFSLLFSQPQSELFNASELTLHQYSQYRPIPPLQWKVGDMVEYQLSLGFMGNVGTSIKSVVEENSQGFWVRQIFNVPFQKETVDVLISRETGEVLRLVRNDIEQNLPDQKIEVISEKVTRLVVPAGRYDTLYISGKTKDVSKLDLWMNAKIIPIDGSVKQNFKISLGEVTMEMTRFRFK